MIRNGIIMIRMGEEALNKFCQYEVPQSKAIE